ncbi:MAG: 30S ribosomal protein S17 [Bdellovibrionaceae bacterium]|nr:30S ribosomal protein S17 [Pseudobdellovibrionaceae bacterium]|tara:strand:+ start:46597 stop:46866 length:270 start_codon:yes stop_codon:yes gene_type:complete
MATNERGKPNQVTGVVVSDKMDKTIAVKVSRMVKHKRYGKYIRRSTVFKAHDEQNSAKAGDKVLITESRPLSKTKSWKLSQVIEKAKVL